jgi:hypothetical protein
MFGPYSPLLFYPTLALRARGVPVRAVHWPEPVQVGADWVRAQVEPILDEVGATLVVGKSLGSHAVHLAAERGLAGIWLTPLLKDPGVVAALRQARAPQLLIGGTADDDAWDGAVARELSPHVCEVEGADHGMMVPGPLAASAAVLGAVVTAVEHFLDTALDL